MLLDARHMRPQRRGAPRPTHLGIAALGWLLAACSAVAPGSTASATPQPATASIAPIDLAEVVVRPDEMPLGLPHDQALEGRDVLTQVVISGRESEFQALEGFLDGRSTTFYSEVAGALLSLGLAFDSVDHAQTAYQLYADELASQIGYGFGTGNPPGFGDDGVCDVGPNPALGGLVEAICIWRNGQIVLMAGGPVPAEDLHDIAEEMDRRIN